MQITFQEIEKCLERLNRRGQGSFLDLRPFYAYRSGGEISITKAEPHNMHRAGWKKIEGLKDYIFYDPFPWDLWRQLEKQKLLKGQKRREQAKEAAYISALFDVLR